MKYIKNDPELFLIMICITVLVILLIILIITLYTGGRRRESKAMKNARRFYADFLESGRSQMKVPSEVSNELFDIVGDSGDKVSTNGVFIRRIE